MPVCDRLLQPLQYDFQPFFVYLILCYKRRWIGNQIAEKYEDYGKESIVKSDMKMMNQKKDYSKIRKRWIGKQIAVKYLVDGKDSTERYEKDRKDSTVK